jgi:putative ABC transport system permease protein
MTKERRIWGPDVRQDVEDEIAHHLAERQRDLEARGMSTRDSREAALRRFGNVRVVVDICRRIDEQWYREQRRANMFMDLRQDVAYALRSLVRAPAFTLVAVITLALGIGATTAIFSVLHSVLLRPLPYADASRIVFLWSTSNAFPREPLTPGRLVDFREQLTSVRLMAGISQIPFNLTGSGEPERLHGSSVSSAFFDVLGVRPLLGETFHANRADDRDVVLSYGLWVRRFASDRSIVGRTIALNGTARTVVAVMPPDFDWPAVTGTPGLAEGPELWVPGISRDIPRTPVDRPDLDLAANRRAGYIRAVARLNDGVTIEQAQREAEAIAARLARQYPDDDAGRGAVLVPLRTQFFGSVRRPMLILFAAAGFVLAIACANVANLLLGRGSSRRGEIAVRLALGASRGRVLRQFLTESVVLSLAGAALGALLASWAQAVLMRIAPGGLPRVHGDGLNLPVLAFTLAVAVVAGLIFGTAPALQAARETAAADLKESGSRGTGGRRSGRVRDVLAAAQVGIALVLLVGATLLLRSFAALSSVDTGIDTRNLLTFDLVLSGARAQYQARQVSFYDEVLRAIAAVPGVAAAGAAVTLPIGGDDFAAPVVTEGQPAASPGDEPRAGYQVVTPGYFAAMGIPFAEGRDFRPGDTRSSPPVVLVNETFARQRWPGGSAIGRRVRIASPDDPWMTIVGVVGDIRHLGPATPPRPEIYQPHTQRSFPFMAFVVRTHADPVRAVPSIRAAVARLDPSQPVSGVATMEEHIGRALSRPRIISTLVGAFGALALVLAIVGTYGVTAYAVAQRSREIAIRSALGADRRSIIANVLRRVAVVAGAGAVGGLVLAVATVRGLSGLLYEVNPLDIPTFAAVVLLLLATALAAGAVPARRAARASPLDALRV